MDNPTVLLVGPIKTQSSWGSSCREYARSIKTFTDNLHIANFHMGGLESKTESEFDECIKNKFEKYDYLIQMVLPHLFYKDYRFKKNLGIFFTEAAPCKKNTVYSRMSILDHIMVPSKFDLMVYQSRLFDTKTNITNIGLPFDTSVVDKKYEDISNQIRKNKGTYCFYTIAEDNERKDLDAVVSSYLTAFSKEDNVTLTIKTNKDIMPRIITIRDTLRCKSENHYPEILVISDRMSDEEIMALHKTGDCFVSMTHGESWCIPAMEAMALGSHIIVPAKMGMEDFLTDESSKDMSTQLLPVTTDMCFVEKPPLDSYYTGVDKWQYTKKSDMILAMKRAYITRPKQNKDIVLKTIDKFSYTNVGKNIKKCLES